MTELRKKSYTNLNYCWGNSDEKHAQYIYTVFSNKILTHKEKTVISWWKNLADTLAK